MKLDRNIKRLTVSPKEATILIVATCGPDTPERCAAPFFFSQKAAVLGARVSICFILQSPLLLKQGVARNVYAKEGGRPVSDFIQAALDAGVEFYVCDAALKIVDMLPAELIEEVDSLVGPNFLITRGLEADLVLNF
jgi:predicted peroxiredoxin